MTLEERAKLMQKINSIESIKNIWKKTVATSYSVFKKGLCEEEEYLECVDQTTYICAKMAS